MGPLDEGLQILRKLLSNGAYLKDGKIGIFYFNYFQPINETKNFQQKKNKNGPACSREMAAAGILVKFPS